MGRSLDCIVREARLADDDIEWSAQAMPCSAAGLSLSRFGGRNHVRR